MKPTASELPSVAVREFSDRRTTSQCEREHLPSNETNRLRTAFVAVRENFQIARTASLGVRTLSPAGSPQVMTNVATTRLIPHVTP
ncbi:hypothetical protein AVEN_230128-1 [Araneus ventricosus]|uniref:Uncharacterized protein n=1 Tax=Araneus ventricosus TaxID=182803 RepID=A0A4Y2IGS1_ARAVE|nr:hypothetical protein AVEN_230128-1 [Araneus ventricosus]